MCRMIKEADWMLLLFTSSTQLRGQKGKQEKRGLELQSG